MERPYNPDASRLLIIADRWQPGLWLKVLMQPAFIVVDAIGYLPVRHNEDIPFSQIINTRHDRAPGADVQKGF